MCAGCITDAHDPYKRMAGRGQSSPTSPYTTAPQLARWLESSSCSWQPISAGKGPSMVLVLQESGVNLGVLPGPCAWQDGGGYRRCFRGKQGWGPPCWTRLGYLHQPAEMGIGQGGTVLYGFTELVYSTDVREGRKTSLGLMLSEKMFWFVRLSERMVVSDVQLLHCFKECFAIKIKDRKIIYNYKTLSK